MLLSSIFALIFLFLIYFYNRNRKGKSRKTFPSPPCNFFLGHALQVTSVTAILTAFSEFRLKHKTMRIRLGFIEGLATEDYKLVEFLLNESKSLKKSFNYQFAAPWLGDTSLLLTHGDKWRRIRKILTPAFHFGILKDFIGTFEEVGATLVEKIQETPAINIDPLISLCTLDAICESAMGTKINAQKDQNSSYVTSVKQMCKIILTRSFSPTKILTPIFKLTRDYQTQKKVIKILKNFSTQVINTKKQDYQHHQLTKTKKPTLLDLLIHYSNTGHLISDEEIENQVNTFMFAGHDTTAAGISFALFSLANHSEVQEKVLKEQEQLFGVEKNPEITYEDLQNMTYLDWVIKETLRLYPPVPLIGRLTCKDLYFEDYIIPSGTNIVIGVYALHRDPNIFPEPEIFNPDRFENFDRLHPYAYIPFSAGMRNCIGQKFAMLEMKSVISKIVRHFELLPTNPKHELLLAPEVVLKSLNGIKIGFKKRKVNV